MEAPVRTQLRDAQYSLGNEEYNKFAASLAEDPRIMTHLPGLAINALQDYSDSPRVSHSIDTNQTGTVSKREVRAAAGDPSKFDPVHRKALPYVVDNFEKFRELNPNDGDFIGNNWDITHLDLRVGLDQIILRDSAKKSVSDMKLVHHNFDKVDVNQSGKITNSEVANFGRRYNLSLHSNAVPKMLYTRELPDSEELTKKEYFDRMTKHETELNRISSQWGLK